MKIVESGHPLYPYEVKLNAQEWPIVTWQDAWHERPIHTWVKQNCGAHIFSPQGWIMMARESDVIQLQLTWSQP